MDFKVIVATEIDENRIHSKRATVVQTLYKNEEKAIRDDALQALIRKQFWKNVADDAYVEAHRDDEEPVYYVVSGDLVGDFWFNLKDVTWETNGITITPADTESTQVDMRTIYKAQLEYLQGAVTDILQNLDEYRTKLLRYVTYCMNATLPGYVQVEEVNAPFELTELIPSFILLRFGQFYVRIDTKNGTPTGTYEMLTTNAGFNAKTFEEAFATLAALTDEEIANNGIPHFFMKFAGKEEEYTMNFNYQVFDPDDFDATYEEEEWDDDEDEYDDDFEFEDPVNLDCDMDCDNCHCPGICECCSGPKND